MTDITSLRKMTNIIFPVNATLQLAHDSRSRTDDITNDPTLALIIAKQGLDNEFPNFW